MSFADLDREVMKQVERQLLASEWEWDEAMRLLKEAYRWSMHSNKDRLKKALRLLGVEEWEL